MEICRIQWQETIPLRHAVLWPEKAPEFCHVEGDKDAWHFGAFHAGRLVSVASVYPDGDSARLRKFATATGLQGQGIGTRMVEHILSELKRNGFSRFWCDARESAMGFYQRFGMKPYGERFYKSDVPYFKMSVPLESAL
ncbi:GNAT family N-acetyltransferase [Spongorhabdus nitratireducens]